MPTDKLQTGLRLKEVSYGKLKAIASREGRSFNNLVEFILLRYLEDYEREHGVIQLPEK